MAIDTVLTLTDDLDGTTGETVATREIRINVLTELSDANYARVMAQIGTMLAKARPNPTADSGAKRARGSRKSATPEQSARNKRIRAWAQLNNFEVSDRGRPSKEIESAYVSATGDVG